MKLRTGLLNSGKHVVCNQYIAKAVFTSVTPHCILYKLGLAYVLFFAAKLV